jgi:transcriptional regulator with XRE-family HTH domain
MTKGRIRKEFSERLGALRKTRGMISDKLAAEIGVKGGTYRRWERGEVQPPMEALYEIQRATGCSLNWLICDLGTAYAPETQ